MILYKDRLHSQKPPQWPPGEAQARLGRPVLMKAIKALIVRVATENPSWGYARIQGELEGVGYMVARSTVAKVLEENGIAPPPDTRELASVPQGPLGSGRGRRLLHDRGLDLKRSSHRLEPSS